MLNNIFFKNLLFIFFIIGILILPILAFADADRIFKENSKAVVVVVTLNEKGEPISQGSGFIVSPDGAVVTNYHVISNAKDIKVKVGDKVLDVEGLIYTDKENDLVILKAKGEKLPVVKLGDIANANVGEKVYVISSPEGLENTISDGLLSGIREITSDKKILQITAPISPGSSGGPVFNKDGEVIGVATFLIKEAQNLNFAMPVNLLKDKIESKKAIAVKDSEIEDYKKTAEYWLISGFYLAEAGLYDLAIEAYKNAIRLDNHYAEAYLDLGIAYYNLKMYKDAIEAYKQAIKFDPNDVLSYNNIGIVYHKLGMYKEAVKAYKKAISLGPNFANIYNNLGNTYDDMEMHQLALESYKKALKIKPDYVAYYNLGISYSRLRMNGEAVKAVEQAVIIKPDYVDALTFLGLGYATLKKYEKAIDSVKRAIMISPDNPNPHFYLGMIYMELSDKASALDEYNILKSLNTEKANELFNLIYK